MKRSRLTPAERAAMLARQGGCCVVWGCAGTRGLIEEHSTVHTWTGEKADQLMCVAHHKEKTKRDIKAIAKVRRIVYKKTQFDKRKKAGGTRIKSRGFSKLWRKKFNGSVEPSR
jgi:pyruvate/2-oxoglutarate dehydrogenase complex dihydrolipoamide dehydrogenase (E3) component